MSCVIALRAFSISPASPQEAAAMMYSTGCPGRCWMARCAAAAASAYRPAWKWAKA